MAKVTITFEDQKDGSPSVISDPDAKTLVAMVKSGHQLGESQKLALRALATLLMSPEEYNDMVAKRNAIKAGLHIPSGGLF